MRIGISGNPLLTQKTGIGHYTYNLVKHLAKASKDNEYILLCNFFLRNRGHELLKFEEQNLSLRVSRIPRRTLNFFWNKLKFPSIEMLLGRIDIFHETGDLAPLVKRAKLVLTLYDAIPLKFPHFVTKRSHEIFSKRIVPLAKNADKIIAISLNTKKDIVDLIGLPEEKVNVVYPGVDESRYYVRRNENAVNQVLRKYRIEEGFILYVGTLQPNKNIDRLIEAFYHLRCNSKHKQKLVLCGRAGILCPNLPLRVEKFGLENEVIFTGYISDQDLPELMNAADLFVYPSLYEGFGLPVLEAMACGLPVITSNSSSLLEVVGEVGIMIDPYNVNDLANAMDKVLSSKELQKAMSKKGLERAKSFSWTRVAYETLRVYKQALG